MMDWVWSSVVWCIIVISPAWLLLPRGKSGSRRLPPGPPGWPVFGHVFKLGSMPHKTMAGLRKQYGPVVRLGLGWQSTVVVLTAEAAAELFKQHDLSFAERTITSTMQSHGYHSASLALAPYGPYWRALRRVCTAEMLSPRRIQETEGVRRRCVDQLLRWVGEEEAAARAVSVGQLAFLTAFNMLGELMLSREQVDALSKEGSELFEAMTSMMEWGGHPNVADLFPWLRWLDPQGLRRKMDRDVAKALKIASALVEERRAATGEGQRDFLDVLLHFRGNGKDEPDTLSDHQLNIFILEIFLAGSGTSSSTIEWAMVELLCNPKAMAKVKAELAAVVGRNRKLEESDIDDLPYLQAVIKETMRLHPPIPLLVPRKAIHDTTLLGYHIPKNTQLFVNVWAIGRDPEWWDDPMSFRPERFMGPNNIDYRGQCFEFIPFGAGRRMCAGLSLGHRMLHLILGALLHGFEWELESHVTAQTMDTRERMGVTVRKLEPLRALPKKHVVTN